MERAIPKLSAVIPVYRSASWLVELHERLGTALAEITPDYEILFVDDASPDNAWSVLESIRERDPRVRLFQLLRNSGQQRAVLLGLSESRGDVVVTMDDDLQQRPEDIHLLVDALGSGDVNVVFGSYGKKEHGRLRNGGSRLVKELAFRMLGIPREVDLTSFRALDGFVAREVSKQRNANPVIGFLIFEVTHRLAAVETHHDPRAGGESGYGWRDLVNYFFCMLMDYSDWPLRTVGYAGVALALGSFAIGSYTLFSHWMGWIQVSGFATVVLLITALSGFILMGLGTIGSYLVRILRQGNFSRLPSIRRRMD
jgi:glycosyltransferase involved in cell wall biosynthesis